MEIGTYDDHVFYIHLWENLRPNDSKVTDRIQGTLFTYDRFAGNPELHRKICHQRGFRAGRRIGSSERPSPGANKRSGRKALFVSIALLEDLYPACHAFRTAGVQRDPVGGKPPTKDNYAGAGRWTRGHPLLPRCATPSMIYL